MIKTGRINYKPWWTLTGHKLVATLSLVEILMYNNQSDKIVKKYFYSLISKLNRCSVDTSPLLVEQVLGELVSKYGCENVPDMFLGELKKLLTSEEKECLKKNTRLLSGYTLGIGYMNQK